MSDQLAGPLLQTSADPAGAGQVDSGGICGGVPGATYAPARCAPPPLRHCRARKRHLPCTNPHKGCTVESHPVTCPWPLRKARNRPLRAMRCMRFTTKDDVKSLKRPSFDRVDCPGRQTPRAVVSLFSGGGGLDLGLEDAGFCTAVCIEHDADCRATLRHNRPGWNAIDHQGGDIRAISTAVMLKKSGLQAEEAALVVGGAPCQPFSNIGSRAGTESVDGTLFKEFMRVVRGFRPQGFIFENVAAITHSRHREVVEFLQSEGARLGYGVTVAVLNAADFGVPQKRLRMFALGCRSGRAPALPVPEFGAPDEGRQLGLKPWRTVGSAIMRIPKSRLGRSDNLCMQVSDLMLRRAPPAGRVFPLRTEQTAPQVSGRR